MHPVSSHTCITNQGRKKVYHSQDKSEVYLMELNLYPNGYKSRMPKSCMTFIILNPPSAASKLIQTCRAMAVSGGFTFLRIIHLYSVTENNLDPKRITFEEFRNDRENEQAWRDALRSTDTLVIAWGPLAGKRRIKRFRCILNNFDIHSTLNSPNLDY